MQGKGSSIQGGCILNCENGESALQEEPVIVAVLLLETSDTEFPLASFIGQYAKSSLEEV